MQQILLVEDDALTALVTSLALEDGGYGVHHAQNAAEAIDALKVDGFAALVTDIDLGQGEDGFGVARHWRALHPHGLVVFVSGQDAHRYAQEAVHPSDLITKPFEPDQVVALLNKRLH